MGCQYSDWDGKCSIWNENIENPGCDEEGNCICEDDENPSMLCEDYESNEDDEWDEEDDE